MSMLSQLPEEMLVRILSQLALDEVLHLSSVCASFRSAADVVYRNHRNRIRGDYGQKVSLLNFHGVKNILSSKYGYTLGLWKIVSTVYGGLLEVKFDGFRLIGTRYYPPPDDNVNGPLRPKKVFIIDVDDEGLFECICLRGNGGFHNAEISKFEENGFQLDCKDSEVHRHPLGPSADLDIFLREKLGVLEEEEEDMQHSDQQMRKYEAFAGEFIVKCRPLLLPPYREDAVIQPGLFKGLYSGHGVELLLLSYSDEDKSAIITKIIGDENVPAGEISIISDLSQPKLKSGDAVTNMQSNSLPLSSTGVPMKRFKLPDSVLSDSESEVLPEFYLYKFNSDNQVAYTGFVEPTFIKGEWVIFDNDSFGNTWLSLHSFSMFKRVTENFASLHNDVLSG